MPASLAGELDRAVVEPLRALLPGARWTRPEGRHLTLKFLGEVADERVPSIESAIADASRGHAAFDAALARVGGFPNLKRPRVLWVGIGTGAEPMAALARDVDAALEPLGFEPEGRPYSAHLTLARFKPPARVGELPSVDVPAEPFRVDGVVLFRSELRRDGARYTALASVSL